MSFTLAGFHVTGAVIMLGLVTGMTYGILAAGLVLVFRASRIINFAYGDIGAFGAALLGVSTTKWGVPYWAAFLLAIAASAAVSAVSEVVVIRRLKDAPLVVSVIATLGLGQLISAISSIVDGSVGAGTSYPQPAGFPTFSAGALLLTPAYTAMLFLSPLIVVGLSFFLRRGRLGVAMRASAANPDAAEMAGMNARRLTTLAWAIAGAVAACTVILVLPTRGFSGGEFLGPGLLLRGLVCAVVARMVNLPVALISGVVLGVVEQLLLFNYPSGGQVEMVIFVIIIIALLLQRSHAGRSEEKGSWLAVAALEPLPYSLRQLPSVRRLGWIAAGIAIPAGLIIPLVTTNENATTFGLIAAFAVIGLSLSLVTGLGGQLSLGQFAVAGVGAVASFVIADHGGSFLFGLAAAAAAGGATSIVIGLPALRIRGLMLAVTTLGFALAAEDWLFQQSWMLGTGVTPKTLAIGSFAFNTGKRYYLVAFAVLLFAVWLARNVWNSRISRQVRAVRDNEDAARSFGVHATTLKLQTFVIGGFLAGLGGAVYGHLLAQEGSSAFTVDSSIDVAAIVVIGGLGLLAGPILGSLYIIGIPQFIPLDNVGLAATSLGWLFLILFYPGGIGQTIAPYRDRLVDYLARRAGLDPVVERAVTPGAGIGTSGAGVPLTSTRSRRVPTGSCLLRAEGLTKRFGGVIAVDHVNLEVQAGEILGLIGPNGAGKTTLFELLGGFGRADTGTISYEGSDITGLAPERRAELGLIRSFQDAALFPSMTVHEVVMLALERSLPTRFVTALSGLGGRSDRRKGARAEELLASLGLLSFRDTKVAALSTGTRRITELGCLIALEPTLLLLDEPTSGIAQRESEALGDVLRTIRAELDLTMVVIEHDIPLLMGLADRVAAMESGQVITIGTPLEVQSDPRVVASYLGGDVRAIERSERRGGRVTAGRGGNVDVVTVVATCRITDPDGAPCAQPAGPGRRVRRSRADTTPGMTGNGHSPTHQPAAPPSGGVDLLSNRLVDARMAELALPLPNRPPLSDRALVTARGLTATRRGTVLSTLWVLALVISCTTLLARSQVRVRTPFGPAKASCGLDVYLYGYPDHAVAAACRHAEAGRFELFIPAIVLVVAGGLIAAMAGFRSGRRSARVAAIRATVSGAPVRSGLVALGTLAAAVALFALHTIPVVVTSSGHPVSVSCGANAYFFGFPGSAIRTACQRAFGGQAHVLVDALAVTIVGLLALCSLLYSAAGPLWRRQRLLWIVGAMLLAAVAVAALLPVPVEIRDASGSFVANCGVDSFVAGYPDQAVEAACRAHASGHAVTAAIAALLSLLAFGGALRATRQGWVQPGKAPDPEITPQGAVSAMANLR